MDSIISVVNIKYPARSLFVLVALFHIRSRAQLHATSESTIDLHPLAQTQIENKSVTLDCDLPLADPPDITWADLVYNTGPDPCHIFSSLDNPGRVINVSHPNHINFEIQPQLSLTINSLKMDSGPGLYYCTSRKNGTLYRRMYNLAVGSEPTCWGETNLLEGQVTRLWCQAKYSGNTLPRLEWFKMDTPMVSKDEFEIREARRSVELEVTHRDDRALMNCQMSFANITRSCQLRLRVQYAVRDIAIQPQPVSGKLSSDKSVNCSALGNPPPRVQLQTTPFSSQDPDVDLQGSAAAAGVMRETVPSGYRTMQLKAEWQKKLIHFYCSASNEHNGRTETIYTNLSALIVEPEKSTGAKIAKQFEDAMDHTPFVIGVIVGVSLLLLVIIITVTLVRKHKEKQRRKRAKAAAAEAKQQSTAATHPYNGKADDGKKKSPVAV